MIPIKAIWFFLISRAAEKYFYPIHGAGTVKAIDADDDGLIDLAVTAFFPDPQQTPNKGFLLFHQKKNLQFEITTFADASLGRWLVMDTGDLNRDGKADILLGNFMKSGLGQKTGVKNAAALVLLMRKKGY